MSEAFEEIDPLANPGLVNELTRQFTDFGDDDFAEAPEQAVKPTIRPLSDGAVELPGGLIVGEKRITSAEIQELTGLHEERIVKARGSADPGKFMTTVLKCGVVAIGDDENPDVDELLAGDRDFLLLAIRKATYGAEIELGEIACTGCGEYFDAVGNVDDIPVKRLASASEREFEVRLRKGGTATVILPDGRAQRAALDDGGLSVAERNSIWLTKCLTYIEDADGEMIDVAAQPSAVLDLGILDRRKILNEIAERMPGPRYDEFVIEHECGEKIPAPVGLMSLFPGL